MTARASGEGGETCSPWRPSWRTDPVAAVLADRRYNRQAHGATQFVPPGRRLVLLTADRCLRRAGWQNVGFTAGGIYVLQQLPSAMPPPAPVPGAQPALFRLESVA